MKRQKVFLLVGCPGSGKSYFAKNEIKKLQDMGFTTAYISRDNIRYSLISEDEDYFSHEGEVIDTFIKEIQFYIDNDVHFIFVDATHCHYKGRMAILRRLCLNRVDVIPIVMMTDLKTCLARNAIREGRACVPENTVKRMYHSYSSPCSDGFPYESIWFIKDGEVTIIKEWNNE